MTRVHHHCYQPPYICNLLCEHINNKTIQRKEDSQHQGISKKIARQNTIYFLTLCLTIWLLTVFLLFRITNHHNHMNSVCVNVKWRWRRWWQWICMTSCVIFQNVRKSSKLSCFFLFLFSFDEVFSWMVSWRKLVKSIK